MTNARTRLGWVVCLTSTAYFMVALDALVVITALPRVQRDLHVGLSSLQWTVNAYGIAFAAGIITAAALDDRFGRRRVFNCRVVLVTIASAACELAPNAGELIAARTVQGLGGAVVLPLSLTILMTAFPAEKRGMIVGVYGGLAGLAVHARPVLGGLVTEGIDWRPERLDLAGAGLVTAGVVAIVWALTRANAIGRSSPEAVATLAAGAILLAAFLAWAKRVSQPMVPLRLFAVREFALGNVTTFLMSGSVFAAAFFVTQEFQFARGYSPLGTGVRLLPFFATPMFVAPIAGALFDRVGRRPIMVAGLALQTVGLIWVAARGSLTISWVELTVALLIAGVGISMALPTVPTAVLSAVSPEEMGKASGINYMAQRFGAVFSIAIGSAVFSAYGHLGGAASVTAGFRPALCTSAALALLAAVGAAGITSRHSTSAHVEPVEAADRRIALEVDSPAKGDRCRERASSASAERLPELDNTFTRATRGATRR